MQNQLRQTSTLEPEQVPRSLGYEKRGLQNTVRLDDPILQSGHSQKDPAESLRRGPWPKSSASVNRCVVRFRPVAGGHAVADNQPFGSGRNGDRVAIADITRQQHFGELILKRLLDHPL